MRIVRTIAALAAIAMTALAGSLQAAPIHIEAAQIRTAAAPTPMYMCLNVLTDGVKGDIRFAAPPYSSPGTGYSWGAPNVTDVYTSTGPGTVQYASVSAAAASSPVTIVSGVTGKKIIVLYEDIEATGAAGTLQWQDNAGTPNTFTGAMNITQNSFLNPTPSPYGLLSTSVAGNALVAAVVGSGCTLTGFIIYTTY